MSKQAATLLVGLLALAEGRSDDRNMIREADREDVHRDMDYHNNRRSEQADSHFQGERQTEDIHHSGDQVQHLKHEEEERKYQEELIQTQKDRQYQKAEGERRELEEIEKRIKDKLDDERKTDEDQQKRDEERRMRRRDAKKRRREEAAKADEERQHAQLEAEREHQLEHQDKEQSKPEQASNSLLGRYPSLNLSLSNLSLDNKSNPTVFPAMAPAHKGYNKDFSIDPRLKKRSNEIGSDFVINPHFKTDAEFQYHVQGQDTERSRQEEKIYSHEESTSQKHSDSHSEEYVVESVEKIPFIYKGIQHEIDAGEHGDDERRSRTLSSLDSSSSSESSSSVSSSSSSTSSLNSTSEDAWVSDDGGYHTMDEGEVKAYERWVVERQAKHRRAHAVEEELLRYEEEQRHRQELSAGKYSSSGKSSSDATSSEGRRSSAKSSTGARKKIAKKEEVHFSSGEESGPFELDSGYGLSSEEDDHEQRAIRDLHEKYELELAAAHSDEEHYYAHYSKLQEEMQHLADDAERVKYEARHDAREADDRAQSAEQKVKEAEKRASELERQAKEAQERVTELESQARHAEHRVHQVEREWQKTERKMREHERSLRESESEEERHYRANYRAVADPDYDELDFSSYGEEVVSHGEVADDLPASTEPVQYMKHGKKRHKKILADRKVKRGKRGDKAARIAKKLADDPQARKKAKKALEENPELAKKTKKAAKKAVKEIAETDTQLGKSLRKVGGLEAERDTEKRREEMGEWGHATTVYPDQYKGPILKEESYIYENPDEQQTKKQQEKSHKKIDERGMEREHARTVYPAGYTAPKVDDKDMKKPVSPMVEKHERPIHLNEEAHHIDFTDSAEQDQYLEADRQLREFRHRGMDLESEYHHPSESHQNEAIGSAMIEENEKERALELFRKKTEQELKNEYDRKIMEITVDFKAKLKDMDHTYAEKQIELDHERSDIERSVSMAHDAFDGDYTRRDTPLEYGLEHTGRQEFYSRPSPETQTFDETDFGFVRDRPVYYSLNLASKQVPNQVVKDPMADIKKREQDLQHERISRETELQSDYEKRLAEFEKDYHEKEAVLEVERLEAERAMIAEREHQIELDAKVARKVRKAARKAALIPVVSEPFIRHETEEEPEEDDNDESYDDEDEMDDLDDSELDYEDSEDEMMDFEDQYGDRFDDEFDDYNGQKNTEFSSEGEAEFFQKTQDSQGKDVYELEWDLDWKPKNGPKANPKTASEPVKKQRKQKKEKKEKKDTKKQQLKNQQFEEDAAHKHHHTHKQDKPTTKKNKNRNQKKQEQNYPERKHRHRHNRQNGISEDNFDIEYSQNGDGHKDLGHEPIVTERYGNFDGYDYGQDVTGQAYRYEKYALPYPTLPDLPIARVPMRFERPAHPLQGYANAREYVYGQKNDGPQQPAQVDQQYKHYAVHEALPTGFGNYPDQLPGPEFIQSPQQTLHRERYGPQFHDRTHEQFEEPHRYQEHHQFDHHQEHPQFGGHQEHPQFVDHQDYPQFVAHHVEPHHHKEDVEYDLFDHSIQRPLYPFMPAAEYRHQEDAQNDMQTRTFPKIQTHAYSPETYAASLEKAHKAGHLPPHEEEVPLHRAHRRHQTRSFEDFHEIIKADGMPAHQDHTQMLDDKPQKKVGIPATPEQRSKNLNPKIPKNIKHVTDLPPQWPSAKKQQHSTAKQGKRKEEKRDIIPQADLSAPGAFQARRDPFGVDFEKIAMQRAAKQAQFQMKYEDEQYPWDIVHGGRFAYHGEHRADDKEMADSPAHSSLEKAFDESNEEYHQHTLMKPRFEDFKLQFEGLHAQVADQISTADIEHAYGQYHEQRRLEDLGIGLDSHFEKDHNVTKEQQEDAMPQFLQQTGQIPVQRPQTQSQVPSKPLPVMMSQYDSSPVARTETESPLNLDVINQHLEDPSIHDTMRKQQQSRFSSMPKAQQEYELPVFDPSRVKQSQQQQQRPQAYAQQQQPTYVQQQLQQPYGGSTSYFPSQQQTQQSSYGQSSMYQAPTQWYAQQPQQQSPYGSSAPQQRQPQYMGQQTQIQRPQQQPYGGTTMQQQRPQSPVYPTQMPMTAQMYPSTPYMPPELTQMPISPQAQYPTQSYQQQQYPTGVLPTKSLPYQPRQAAPQQMPQQPMMATSQYTQPQTAMSTSSGPGIKMTRDLTPKQTGTPYQRRNNLDYSRHMLPRDSHFENDFADDQDEPFWSDEDIHQIYTDDSDQEHPVYVTSTNTHSYFNHGDSDEFIVGTYLESKYDLDVARESNKFLQ